MSQCSEWYVDCASSQRDAIIERLLHCGHVENRWQDGSFNFVCNTAEDADYLTEVCEDYGVDCQLIQ